MKKPEALPPAVVEGIRRYCRQHAQDDSGPPVASELIAALQWDSIMGCYHFTRCGMFHGVELDGHIHT